MGGKYCCLKDKYLLSSSLTMMVVVLLGEKSRLQFCGAFTINSNRTNSASSRAILSSNSTSLKGRLWTGKFSSEVTFRDRLNFSVE